MKSFEIQIGTVLKPIPLWNKTERPPNQLPPECEVLAIMLDACQSGVMVTVKNKSENLIWLDSEWFEGVNA